MIALKRRQRRARLRPNQSVNRTGIISLIAQGQLDVLDYLTWVEVIVTVDRLTVSIVIVERAVTERRIPIAEVPIIIAAAKKNEPGVVVAPPPVAIVIAVDGAAAGDGIAVAINLLSPIFRLFRSLRPLAVPRI